MKAIHTCIESESLILKYKDRKNRLPPTTICVGTVSGRIYFYSELYTLNLLSYINYTVQASGS